MSQCFKFPLFWPARFLSVRAAFFSPNRFGSTVYLVYDFDNQIQYMVDILYELQYLGDVLSFTNDSSGVFYAYNVCFMARNWIPHGPFLGLIHSAVA